MKRFALFLCLLLPMPTAAAPSARQQKLQAKLERIAAGADGMRVGAAVWHFADSEKAELDGNVPYPLASVFKLPLMLELARQMQQGAKMSLTTQLTVRSSEKCIGSGIVKDLPDGTRVGVERLIELMETISDNTATDMLFRRIGLESVDKMMREIGCLQTEIQMTNRAAWLISLGASRQFHGMSPARLASTWRRLSVPERLQAARSAENENTGLSLSAFQRMEDASNRNTHAQDVLIATTIDNLASPTDLARALQQLDSSGKLLDKKWRTYCLGVLSRQHYNSRIPRGLPSGAKVFHKTGTIAGVVNDAGLVELPDHSKLAIVVLVQQVGAGQHGEAERLIASVARAAYGAYSAAER